MTNELSNADAIEVLKNDIEICTIQQKQACDMAIKALRYKPIILQEHDAEPRRLKAILDVKTNDIYILETTKGFAEGMGMTIEIRESDANDR
jgi:hypothetical protein